ncbi:MAG: hypothetical protein HY659_11070 [Rhizobiales bacterium]|nr:hypothetical protein [Hyphomicrobiales bacterium]
MARLTGRAHFAMQDDPFDTPALLRLGLWGAAAVFALILAVAAARSDIGNRRLVYAYAAITTPPGVERERASAVANVTRPLIADPEGRRLIEAVHALTADRDRLLARLGMLERNLDDMTGSINRPVTLANESAMTTRSEEAPALSARSASATAVAPKGNTEVNTTPATAPGVRVANAHAIARGEAPPSDSTATKTEFGVDIGGATTIEKLRAIWLAERTAHTALLRDMRPVVAVRQGNKQGATDLRLVVGPLANASAAARLCARLASAGLHCTPSVYDGQKLSVR